MSAVRWHMGFRRIIGLLVTVSSTALVAVAAAPIAWASSDHTWSGNTLPATWSNSGNWVGGAPGGGADTLAFPAPLRNCTNRAAQACYDSVDDVGGIAARALSIDDGYSYVLVPNGPSDGITLGAGGLSASTALANASGAPEIQLPITLASSQTWSLDGGPHGSGQTGGQLIVDGALGGAASSLTIDMQRASWLSIDAPVDDELGAVDVVATDASHGGLYLSNTTLNGSDGNPVSFSRGVGLSAGGRDTVGPLTMSGGQVDLIGDRNTPSAAVLTVRGAVSLDSASTLFSSIVGAGGSPAPGTDYAQLRAIGNVDLGGAYLSIRDLSDPGGSCSSLPRGTMYTLVSTSGGTIRGGFGNAPNGSVVGAACNGGAPSTFMIRYTSDAVTATVVDLTTTASATPASVVTNQAVTLSANVSTSLGAPVGVVGFMSANQLIAGCYPVPIDSAGHAVCQATFRAASSPDAVTAVYYPAAGATSSGMPSSGVAVAVNRGGTATALSSPDTTPRLGHGTTYSASVTADRPGTLAPDGTIQFSDNGTPLSGCASQALVKRGGAEVATCIVTYSSPGPHAITAAYSGSNDFLPSSAATSVSIPALPSVSIKAPGLAAVYRQGQKVVVSYRCRDGAGGPGIASCVGSARTGARLDTSKVGRHLFTVTATSSDGEVRTEKVAYTVAGGAGIISVLQKPHSDGTFIVTVGLPDAGGVDVLVTAWKDNLAASASRLQPATDRFVFARAHAVARRAGKLRIVVSPDAAGRRLVKHHRYRVTLRLWVSYTPVSGHRRDFGFYGLHLP